MKIDTHQHYWRYRAEEFPWISPEMPALQRDCMPPDCEASMRAAGIDGVVAVQARTNVQETDFLLQLADQYDQILGVVGWADLGGEDLDHRLEQWCMHASFKGLRHILQDETNVPNWVNLPAINAGMHALQLRSLVYEVLVFESQLVDVIGFCKRHDQHWLVLDHVAKPALRERAHDAHKRILWSELIRELGQMPHVMCKLSGLITETDWIGRRSQGPSVEDSLKILETFDMALEAFGPQRLMFGSDWPVCQLAVPYHEVHELAASWANSRLSEDQQMAFWSGNAIRCYGLSEQATTD